MVCSQADTSRGLTLSLVCGAPVVPVSEVLWCMLLGRLPGW